MNIRILEEKLWDAAKNRDAIVFLEVVDKDAIMICGGYKCSGAEYAEIIKEFDVARYTISDYEIIEESESYCQVRYLIEIEVANRRNADLEGLFHITSSWKMMDGTWKLIFNMDSRINYEI